VEKDYWSVCGRISGKMVTVMKQLDYEVTDLMENFCYVFRVMASNAIGDGEPLNGLTPIVAKFALDPPEQPYNINIVDYDSKWVSLDWSVASGPKADKYIVEKLETFLIPKDEEEEQPKKHNEEEEGEEEERPKFVMPVPREPGLKRDQEYVEYSTGWIVAGVTDNDFPEIKITEVQEGYRYQFRVKAANKAGVSYPSEPTDEIIAKKRKQKPIIDRCGISDEMHIQRGDHLTLKVKVQGEPITDKSWFWGRREIKTSGSVIVESTDYTSKLHIMCLERVDTGTFYFRADNVHGFTEMAVDVIVMVAPTKPKGPLRIDDICAAGCTAIWNKPEDDGGSPITHYVIEKVHGSGDNFTPCGRVNASETECKIRGFTENKEYRLQVIAVNAMGESEPLVSIDGFVTENPFQTPGAPGKPEMFDWDTDHFDMKWDAPRNDGGSRITGYELEARLARDVAWFRAGEVRMQFERGVVEGVELGSSYSIRVRARNEAGFGPWSMESDQLTCKFKNLPPKVSLEAEKDLTINENETFTIFADIHGEPMPEEITWSINGNELTDNPKNGVIIDNSKEYKSKLQLDVITRKDCGTLTCEVSNMNGKAKATASLHVIGKPSVPQDRLVASNINSSGCKLSWEASKDNGGLDIEYVVDRYEVQADAWASQGSTRNTELVVNDLETGKEYGFRVSAVNSCGESEALHTAKNIVAKNQYSESLPPSAPEVVDGNERQITIRWKAPIDDGGRPITGYHVEAKSVGSTDWQPWEILDIPETHATLTTLQKGFEYQFRVIAVNKAGKSEPSHPSRPRLVKENDLLPFIEMKGLRDITASAKERIKFDVPICGEPAPEVAWFKGDTPVEELEDRHISVTTTDTHTKIVFSSLKKSHEGAYTLTISNRSGSDTAKFSVKVLDRPAAPEPPMKATVEGSNCTLLWKKVKEDGGAPIEHYQIEKQDTEKGSWCACGHTKDNTYTLKGLFPGHSYQFRVCAVNEIGDSDFVTSETVPIQEDSAGRGL
jgi:fibronectin type 3 domain-containing protein